MSYAALSDLVAQFGDREVLALTDRNGDGVADAPVYGMALQRASNTIDAYLAARYPLPLTVVPDQLVDICCDIAASAGIATPNASLVGAKAPSFVRCNAATRTCRLFHVGHNQTV
ncbi:MAG: DUF1320 domain-containing protein [Gallionellaceae bacterium]|nr:DUF1320 domain-containing protein [Gallionellaceae bacterium]